MTITSLLPIIIAVIIVYFLAKIFGPLIRIIAGIVIFLVLIFVLQNFFNFNFTQIFGTFGKSLNLNKWNINLNGIVNLINYYINQAVSFLRYLISNVPKF